jgi:SAM-dependent methyltransferase
MSVDSIEYPERRPASSEGPLPDPGTVDGLEDGRGFLVPPMRLVQMTGVESASSFQKNAAAYLHVCKRWGRLRPDERVLDIGCGVGRLAIPLTHYLNCQGSYEGIDIIHELVAWCRFNISRHHPAFRFQKADVCNKIYNRDGWMKASEYRLPFADATFDFVFVGSVFTHMLPADLENYLEETTRVLKPEGRCLISYFLLDQGRVKARESKADWLDFKYERNGFRTVYQDLLEAAVAYEEDNVRKLYARMGLSIVEPILFGAQDVIAAIKTGSDCSPLLTMGADSPPNVESLSKIRETSKRTELDEVIRPVLAEIDRLYRRFFLRRPTIQEVEQHLSAFYAQLPSGKERSAALHAGNIRPYLGIGPRALQIDLG